MTMRSAPWSFLLLLGIMLEIPIIGAEECAAVSDAEIGDIRRAFELDLFDAQAARFQRVCKFQFKERETDVTAYCGLINAKNRIGAYVGYRPFYYRKGAAKGGVFSPSMDVGDELQFRLFYCMSCSIQPKGFDFCLEDVRRRVERNFTR